MTWKEGAEKKFDEILVELNYPAGDFIQFWDYDDLQLDGDFTREQLRILLEAMQRMWAITEGEN